MHNECLTKGRKKLQMSLAHFLEFATTATSTKSSSQNVTALSLSLSRLIHLVMSQNVGKSKYPRNKWV